MGLNVQDLEFLTKENESSVSVTSIQMYVETKKDLDLGKFSKFECVGISAGASTPTCVIDEIVCVLKEIEGEPC